MPTATATRKQRKIVSPIDATIASHTEIKPRKDGSNYISYCLQCSDGRKRWKSLDADDFYPVGTTLQLVPYWDEKNKEHHQLINVQPPQENKQQSSDDEEAAFINRF